MHIPDGFIDAPVSAAAGVIAVVGIGVALKRSSRELDERTAPMAGLVAVFIFAVQMLNFPIGAGTSGHLLGGALAAILVGPWTGALAVSVVILIQALMFADGGLSATGLNIINMAFVTVAVAWPVFRITAKALPRRRPVWMGAAFLAAFLSVPASALAFVVEYAIGGTGTFSVGTVLAAMVGVHAVIGIGEGVITALTVGAVLAVRPDLVRGVRDLLPDPSCGPRRRLPEEARMRRNVWILIGVGIGVSLLLAGVVSYYASSHPDGLEAVANDIGFGESARDSAIADSPLSDYQVTGIADERIAGGLAGIIGVLVTAALAFGLFLWLGRRGRASSLDGPGSEDGPGSGEGHGPGDGPGHGDRVTTDAASGRDAASRRDSASGAASDAASDPMLGG